MKNVVEHLLAGTSQNSKAMKTFETGAFVFLQRLRRHLPTVGRRSTLSIPMRTPLGFATHSDTHCFATHSDTHCFATHSDTHCFATHSDTHCFATHSDTHCNDSKCLLCGCCRKRILCYENRTDPRKKQNQNFIIFGVLKQIRASIRRGREQNLRPKTSSQKGIPGGLARSRQNRGKKPHKMRLRISPLWAGG